MSSITKSDIAACFPVLNFVFGLKDIGYNIGRLTGFFKDTVTTHKDGSPTKMDNRDVQHLSDGTKDLENATGELVDTLKNYAASAIS